MAAKTTSVTQFRCQKCNAPYPLGADDVIATCPYCGFTFEVGGDEIQHQILPNKLDSKSVKSTVMKWLDSAAPKTVGGVVVKDIELDEPILQWIPVFRVSGPFESYHFGVKTEGTGDNKRHIKVEESDSGILTEWVIARRHAATFGINEFILSLSEEVSGFSPFIIRWTRLTSSAFWPRAMATSSLSKASTIAEYSPYFISIMR